MAIWTVDRESWQFYFDVLSMKIGRDERPWYVKIQPAASHPKDMRPGHTSRLRAIAYHKNDHSCLHLALEDDGYEITRPRQIWVSDDEDGSLNWLVIIGSDGTKELISRQEIGIGTGMAAA